VWQVYEVAELGMHFSKHNFLGISKFLKFDFPEIRTVLEPGKYGIKSNLLC